MRSFNLLQLLDSWPTDQCHSPRRWAISQGSNSWHIVAGGPGFVYPDATISTSPNRATWSLRKAARFHHCHRLPLSHSIRCSIDGTDARRQHSSSFAFNTAMSCLPAKRLTHAWRRAALLTVAFLTLTRFDSFRPGILELLWLWPNKRFTVPSVPRCSKRRSPNKTSELPNTMRPLAVLRHPHECTMFWMLSRHLAWKRRNFKDLNILCQTEGKIVTHFQVCPCHFNACIEFKPYTAITEAIFKCTNDSVEKWKLYTLR